MADLNDIAQAVGRVEAKLDTALTTQADHETRLRDLEGTKKYSTGFAAAIGAVVTFLLSMAGAIAGVFK